MRLGAFAIRDSLCPASVPDLVGAGVVGVGGVDRGHPGVQGHLGARPRGAEGVASAASIKVTRVPGRGWWRSPAPRRVDGPPDRHEAESDGADLDVADGTLFQVNPSGDGRRWPHRRAAVLKPRPAPRAAPGHAPGFVVVVADRTPLSDSSSASPGTHLGTCSLRPPFNTTLLGGGRRSSGHVTAGGATSGLGRDGISGDGHVLQRDGGCRSASCLRVAGSGVRASGRALRSTRVAICRICACAPNVPPASARGLPGSGARRLKEGAISTDVDTDLQDWSKIEQQEWPTPLLRTICSPSAMTATKQCSLPATTYACTGVTCRRMRRGQSHMTPGGLETSSTPQNIAPVPAVPRVSTNSTRNPSRHHDESGENGNWTPTKAGF